MWFFWGIEEILSVSGKSKVCNLPPQLEYTGASEHRTCGISLHQEIIGSVTGISFGIVSMLQNFDLCKNGVLSSQANAKKFTMVSKLSTKQS